MLSGVIGWAGGVALSLAIASQRKDMSEGFTRNVWLFSTLGVMSASVWIELLAKPGTLARAQTGLTSIPHPINAVKRLMPRLLAGETIQHAFLGIGSQEVTAANAGSLHVQLLPYECHEGNYMMLDSLEAARQLEKQGKDTKVDRGAAGGPPPGRNQ